MSKARVFAFVFLLTLVTSTTYAVEHLVPPFLIDNDLNGYVTIDPSIIADSGFASSGGGISDDISIMSTAANAGIGLTLGFEYNSTFHSYGNPVYLSLNLLSTLHVGAGVFIPYEHTEPSLGYKPASGFNAFFASFNFDSIQIYQYNAGPYFLVQLFAVNYTDGYVSDSQFPWDDLYISMALGLSISIDRDRSLLNKAIFPRYVRSWGF